MMNNVEQFLISSHTVVKMAINIYGYSLFDINLNTLFDTNHPQKSLSLYVLAILTPLESVVVLHGAHLKRFRNVRTHVLKYIVSRP